MIGQEPKENMIRTMSVRQQRLSALDTGNWYLSLKTVARLSKKYPSKWLFALSRPHSKHLIFLHRKQIKLIMHAALSRLIAHSFVDQNRKPPLIVVSEEPARTLLLLKSLDYFYPTIPLFLSNAKHYFRHDNYISITVYSMVLSHKMIHKGWSEYWPLFYSFVFFCSKLWWVPNHQKSETHWYRRFDIPKLVIHRLLIIIRTNLVRQ